MNGLRSTLRVLGPLVFPLMVAALVGITPVEPSASMVTSRSSGCYGHRRRDRRAPRSMSAWVPEPSPPPALSKEESHETGYPINRSAGSAFRTQIFAEGSDDPYPGLVLGHRPGTRWSQGRGELG